MGCYLCVVCIRRVTSAVTELKGRSGGVSLEFGPFGAGGGGSCFHLAMETRGFVRGDWNAPG